MRARRRRLADRARDDPAGLGRIVRDATGGVRAIVEERDASAAERAIDEINTGFDGRAHRALAGWVAQLTPHNAQREFYLTDIVAMASPKACR